VKYIPGYEENVYGVDSLRKKGSFRFRQWGVTLEMIDEFIRECGGREKLVGLSTREVNRQYMKPLTSLKHKTGTKGASYCSWKYQHRHSGVSDADAFVCHAWDGGFLDFIDALKFHIGEAEYSKTRLWIDIFCNNQHRDSGEHVKQHKSTYLTETLKKSMEIFERFLVFFDNWTDPLVFHRAWSLVELHYGIESGLSLEMVLPRGDIRSFRDAISEEDPTKIPHNMFRMLGKIDIRKAACRHKLQHKLILGAISNEGSRNNLTPVVSANEGIRKFFKNWVIREASYCILDAKHDADPLAEVRAKESLANIFRFDGRPDVASEVYRDSVRFHMESDPECLTAETIHAMFLLANSYSLARDSAKAAKWYEKALTKQLAPLSAVHNDYNLASPEDMVFIRKVLSHPDTLHMVKYLCGELYCCGEMDRLWNWLETVYDQYKVFLGTSFSVQHENGMVVEGVRREYLRYRGGTKLRALRADLEVDHNIGTLVEENWLPARIQTVDIDTNEPHVAMVGNIMGYIYYLDGKYEDADTFIKDALVMRQRYLGVESSETLILMRAHAKAQERLQHKKSANKYYERQYKAELQRYKLRPPSVVGKLILHEATYLWADFLCRSGDPDAANERFDLQKMSFDAAEILGWHHPDAMKLRDLTMRVLETSQLEEKYLKASMFRANYDQLRYKHRDKKLLLVSSEGEGVAADDMIRGSTKVSSAHHDAPVVAAA
jgi:tetratricopeptide (TPR) repeat protein